MVRITKTLSATEIEKTKSGTVQKKLFDGKSKTITFGTFPEISLAQARERREAARKPLTLLLTVKPLNPPEKNCWQTALNLSFLNGYRNTEQHN